MRVWHSVVTVFLACILLSRGYVSADSMTIGADFQQNIPAQGDGHAWMEPVVLPVNRHVIITDIDVYLDINHNEVTDLRILIDSPWSETVMLKNLWDTPFRDPHSNMIGTIFDDEAQSYLSSAIPPYTGRFKPAPEHFLQKFDARDAFGNWTLRILDGAYGNAGILQRWELHITHTPEPAGLTYCLMISLALYLRRKKPLKSKN